LYYILIIGIVLCSRCINPALKQEKLPKVPINYDFDNLSMHLNGHINETRDKIDWRWDHMNSEDRILDSTGIDYFENRKQPLFKFNGEQTLPVISITTNKNRIIEFSTTTIFRLQNIEKSTIRSVMDSLTPFDLLKDESIREEILNKSEYKVSRDYYEEEIILNIRDVEYGYDRMTYSIMKKE